MRPLRYWFIALILLEMGCSGLRQPKDRIDRTTTSYERDLTRLRDYLGSMPVDVAVAGYTPEDDGITVKRYSQDSTQTELLDVVITQLDPVNVSVRAKDGKSSQSIRIPTQYVTTISAFGERTTTEPETRWSYGYAIALAVLALFFLWYETNLKGATGCEGGCQALAILTGGAALVAALTVFLVNSHNDTGVQRKEVIAKTFRIE